MEHREVVQLEEQGKLIIGVDRAMAWKFYTYTPVSEIAEKTGEAPYFEKMVAWLAFASAPLALICSIVLGFVAFGWWGIICAAGCPALYLEWSSLSVKGRSGILGITLFLVAALAVHFFSGVSTPWATGFAAAFLFSLWSVRFLYWPSSFMLRAFVMRNPRAFDYLSQHLATRPAG